MHIAIDCRLGGIAHAGIGRYITHLVGELISQSSTEVRWSIFCTSNAQAAEVLGKHARKKNVRVMLIPARHYTVREQLLVLLALLRLRPDIFHAPHFNTPFLYVGKTVVTIHDLLWHEMRGLAVTTLPAWQYWLKYYLYTLVARRSVSHASAILVPSRSVEKTVTSFYPKVAQKISVTKEGVSPLFVRAQPPEYNWEKRSKHGLLYVGSLYPHKNVILVLQALVELPHTHLTIAGARSVFVESILSLAQNLGVADRVKFFGQATDAQLKQLYANCAALVQPSKSEGFGLTGIEAMASGAPVLCSNIPVFREVYGEHALYFDPLSVQSFVTAFSQLKQPKTQSLVRSANLYAKSFNWSDTAAKTLSVYQHVFQHAR